MEDFSIVGGKEILRVILMEAHPSSEFSEFLDIVLFKSELCSK